MNFYFRDEKITLSDENNILKKYSIRFRDEIFLLILTASSWDDYGYKTDFVVWMHNVRTGIKHGLGTLKIGYKGQDEGTKTINKINKKVIRKLDDDFFSMFSSEKSYKAIFKYFEIEYEELLKINAIDKKEERKDFIKRNVYSLLDGLNDIVYTKKIERDKSIVKEKVFQNSFLRSTSIETILNSYTDIVYQKNGETIFDFCVKGIDFRSTKNNRPSNNIHALIGGNGCGKSYILDSVVDSYINENDERIKKLIIVSFSPFDKLYSYKKYLLNNSDVKINYIGIKDFYIHINNIEKNVFEKLKDKTEIQKDFIDSFYLAIKKDLDLVRFVFNEIRKSHKGSQLDLINLDQIITFDNKGKVENSISERKKELIDYLIDSIGKKTESDVIEENLSNVEMKNSIIGKFSELSSGYQMVVYTLFNLIAHLETGTVVLYDEPEVYLHPPLMLTYIKILREIFIRKNGMGIFATHSPIILQEIPKSCVKVIRRIKEDGSVCYLNLRNEAYASSITSINNEIFKLETKNAGFYKDIMDECKRVSGMDINRNLDRKSKINKVLQEFNNQVGDEGVSIIYDFFYKEEK